MALFLSIFPIVLLIWLMVKKNSMPSYVALPITAVLIYAIKLFYFGDAGMLLNATAADAQARAQLVQAKGARLSDTVALFLASGGPVASR